MQDITSRKIIDAYLRETAEESKPLVLRTLAKHGLSSKNSKCLSNVDWIVADDPTNTLKAGDAVSHVGTRLEHSTLPIGITLLHRGVRWEVVQRPLSQALVHTFPVTILLEPVLITDHCEIHRKIISLYLQDWSPDEIAEQTEELVDDVLLSLSRHHLASKNPAAFTDAAWVVVRDDTRTFEKDDAITMIGFKLIDSALPINLVLDHRGIIWEVIQMINHQALIGQANVTIPLEVML